MHCTVHYFDLNSLVTRPQLKCFYCIFMAAPYHAKPCANK